MKKFILLIAILSAGFISSCSDDEDNNTTTPITPESTFTAKINGVMKNFSVVDVNVIPNTEEDYTDVEITAHTADDPFNTFELNLTRDSGEVYFVQYATSSSNYYQPSPIESFSVFLGENSNEKLTGTFSGTMQSTGDVPDPVTVTDGNFTIYY
ncbi:MAG TPA: hypothetical protein VLB74_05225 [Flavobacterium sp.]|uniref:hypothetical protein n=1 Tax=Flavobacterium sp. TaxID=239 RepID=UPI002BC198DD|nr:hypothetical protein [Flavobacterium sp.]HSD14029.1 hypothetical protein [Flavobacterium sp.]